MYPGRAGYKTNLHYEFSVRALSELKISKEPVGLGTFLPSTFR